MLIESLIRPAFLITYSPDNYYYWNEVNKIPYKELESKIFLSIPYKRVIRDECENFTEFISSTNENVTATENINLFNDSTMFLSKSQIREVNDMFNKEDEDRWENDSAISSENI